jgi:hypothetical protein
MTRTGQRHCIYLTVCLLTLPISGMILLGQSAGGLNSNADNVQSPQGPYTVSWWIRKLSCIEEVPRFFFFIQFKIKFKNLNWLQLKLNRELM